MTTYIKKYYDNNCIICGKDFVTSNYKINTCSKYCKHIKVKKQFEKYKLKNPHNNTWFKLRFKILLRDNFRCQYCGRTTQDGIRLEIDHIIPKSKGGNNNEDNLITSCEYCNLGKSDVLLEQYNMDKIIKLMNKMNAKGKTP